MQLRTLQVYRGSNGDLTRSYYADLCRLGRVGVIAMNLFRAQKCSSRAKKYRGGIRGRGSYRSMAYDRKNYSLSELCKVLIGSGMRYGWKRHEDVKFGGEPSWVLYVDLPQGQVSFHSPDRGPGPDYPGEWDRVRATEERVLAFCDHVLSESLTKV